MSGWQLSEKWGWQMSQKGGWQMSQNRGWQMSGWHMYQGQARQGENVFGITRSDYEFY